jgi:hypothetical protein
MPSRCGGRRSDSIGEPPPELLEPAAVPEPRRQVAQVDVRHRRPPFGKSASQNGQIERRAVERHQQRPVARSLDEVVEIAPGEEQPRPVAIEHADARDPLAPDDVVAGLDVEIGGVIGERRIQPPVLARRDPRRQAIGVAPYQRVGGVVDRGVQRVARARRQLHRRRRQIVPARHARLPQPPLARRADAAHQLKRRLDHT